MTATGHRQACLALHVLTDRTRARRRDERTVIAAALAGGATVVQLRGKDLSGAELVCVGRLARTLTAEAGAVLIVNDRVDIALAVDADGAHVGQDDLPARDARRVLGPDRLLGVSARTVEEALRAERDGADYIGFGPVFSTVTKRDAGAARGLDALRHACAAVRVPVVAIGGMTAHNAGRAIAAGAAGVAVISAIVGAPDITAATRAVREAMTQSLRQEEHER